MTIWLIRVLTLALAAQVSQIGAKPNQVIVVMTSPSSTQASPDTFGGVSSYSPCLFGKGIFVHARQTYMQQTKTFTKTKLI